MELDPKDCQITTWLERGSNKGGFAPLPDNSCSVTHIPTRIRVVSIGERSIHQAKAKAMEELKKKVAEYLANPAGAFSQAVPDMPPVSQETIDAFNAWHAANATPSALSLHSTNPVGFGQPVPKLPPAPPAPEPLAKSPGQDEGIQAAFDAKPMSKRDIALKRVKAAHNTIVGKVVSDLTYNMVSEYWDSVDQLIKVIEND